MDDLVRYRASGTSMNGKREYELDFDARPDDMPAEADIRRELRALVIEAVRDECGTAPEGVCLLLDPRTFQVIRIDE
ncbi:hypothetical protein [Amycolatopsis sp. NPDC004079]|uniref:hypothetical protein n=1 Tax=Amycolatopsis sp. NPDC004079 TaxID=3154549 RepID=UPI0033BF3DFB